MSFVELGHISGFYGVKGWVKIYSLTRPRENICNYQSFYIDDKKTKLHFNKIKVSGKHIIAEIEGISSREDVAPYIKQKLYLTIDELPELKDDYYWHQLVGLSVSTTSGSQLGHVTSLIETGANDVLVIKDANNKETLIPFVRDYYVMSINLETSEMIVEWEDED